MISVFSVVKVIINLRIREQGLDCKNAFLGVYLATENSENYPIKDAKLTSLQCDCVLLGDDIRWLFAVIRDSGMRLSEAVGLLVNDIVLDAERAHVNFMRPSYRRLKTDASKRLIP